MKIFITILFCFLLLSSCHAGTGSLIKITNLQEGYGVWDPGVLDRVKFEKALKIYLRKADSEELTYASPKYIIKHLSEYTIEYAGFIRDGKKLISCQLILDFDEWYPKSKGISEASEFSMIFDGGCSIVSVIYDVENEKITAVMCNGVA